MSGYGLSNLAVHFGIEYQAHDALEDARCAGLLLLRAIAESGLNPEQWLTRVELPIDLVDHVSRPNKWPGPCKREANSDGDLHGEILVFTGSLSIPRHEAADIAAAVGCRVDDGVTKHTTMLVVGDQDLRVLAGHNKSSKHIKAELLIANRILIRRSEHRGASSLPCNSRIGTSACDGCRTVILGARLTLPLPLPGLDTPVALCIDLRLFGQGHS
jgi:DNA polymerase-3 subunit epsilon